MFGVMMPREPREKKFAPPLPKFFIQIKIELHLHDLALEGVPRLGESPCFLSLDFLLGDLD